MKHHLHCTRGHALLCGPRYACHEVQVSRYLQGRWEFVASGHNFDIMISSSHSVSRPKGTSSPVHKVACLTQRFCHSQALPTGSQRDRP